MEATFKREQCTVKTRPSAEPVACKGRQGCHICGGAPLLVQGWGLGQGSKPAGEETNGRMTPAHTSLRFHQRL